MKMYKRIFGVLLCLCMLLGAVSLAGATDDNIEVGGQTEGGNTTEEGQQTHENHPICGAKHTNIGDHTSEKCFTPNWTKLYMDGDGKLCYGEGQQVTYDSASDYYKLPAGTYYLGTNLTLNSGIQIDSNGGDVTLCLNGKTISCGTGAAIQVKGLNNKNITFTLCDCEDNGVITHTGNDEKDTGGNGVNVENSGNDDNNETVKFIMYNGHITQNKGSGVYLNANTSFTMYGGSITQNGYNNTSLFGGNGSGVYVFASASFTMYGGSITGNYADKNGGGVYASGTMTIGGNVNISGNWKGEKNGSISNNNANNVYLPANSTITIEKALGENSSIGVTTATSVATKDTSIKIAAGKGSYEITDKDKGHFTPDAGTTFCNVEQKTDGLYLTHVHSGGTATCTAQAICTGCNQSYGGMAEHNYEWVSTDTDEHWKKCVNCDTEEANTRGAHSWEITSTTPATCTDNGMQISKCNTCSATKEQTLNATGHTVVTDAAKAPTCLGTGLTEGTHCSVCKTVLVAQKEIPALDHDLEHHEAKAATCTEKGWEAYDTCKREGCGYTTYKEIAALDHDWKAATCTEPKTCQREGCGATEGAALGHDYGEWTVTKEATTTAEGEKQRVCGNDNSHIEKQSIPKLTPRYYYNSTTTTTKDTTKKDTTKSPGTFDPGVGVYALTAVLSVTGMVWMGRKKH